MKLHIFLITFLFCFPAVVSAQYRIKLAAENSWPPFSNETGEGISKDIIQRAFYHVGVEVEFIVVPYARALRMAQLGKVDGAFNVTKQKSTTDKFAFGKVPILQVKASFFILKDQV